MIFAKFAFSIEVRKKVHFGFIFGGQIDEISIKNRLQNVVFFQRPILSNFRRFWLNFRGQKIFKNRKISKKIRLEGVVSSIIVLELLFGWILRPLELDFRGFLSLLTPFWGSWKAIAFGETCVKHFRLRDLFS